MRGALIALPCIWLLATAAQQQPVDTIAGTDYSANTAETPPDTQSDIQYDTSDRMTLPVTVNGHSSVKFLVDTGSERTVVSDELATLLNLPRTGVVKISGTVGSTVAPTAHIESLNFTNISLNGFKAPVLKRQDLGAEGLIGIDSLQKKLVIFDFENHKMEIREAKRRPARTIVNDDEIVVTARNRLGRLVISKAYLDNIPVTIVIDSGAQYSIGNPALLAKLQKKRKPNLLVVELRSVTGQVMSVPVVKAKQLEIGQVNLQGVPIAFADSPAFHTLKLAEKPTLLLGMNSMRAFRRVEVDFTNLSVRFFNPDGAGLATNQRYASR